MKISAANDYLDKHLRFTDRHVHIDENWQGKLKEGDNRSRNILQTDVQLLLEGTGPFPFFFPTVIRNICCTINFFDHLD